MLVVYGVPGSPGASTTAIHVAAHWASSGREVLLVEADPAGGSMNRNLGIQFTPGAASFVASGSPVRKGDLIDHSQDILFTNLHVMPCPSNPSSTREIIESFAGRADDLRDISENDMAVVIDAGRIDSGAFTEKWTASAAGVVVVARGDSGSSMSSLESVAGILAAGVGEPPNGCVVTIGKPLWSPGDFPQKCGMELCGAIEDSPETAMDLSVFLDKAKRKDKKWRSSLNAVAAELLPLAAPDPAVRPRRSSPPPAEASQPAAPAVSPPPAPQPEAPAPYPDPVPQQAAAYPDPASQLAAPAAYSDPVPQQAAAYGDPASQQAAACSDPVPQQAAAYSDPASQPAPAAYPPPASPAAYPDPASQPAPPAYPPPASPPEAHPGPYPEPPHQQPAGPPPAAYQTPAAYQAPPASPAAYPPPGAPPAPYPPAAQPSAPPASYPPPAAPAPSPPAAQPPPPSPYQVPAAPGPAVPRQASEPPPEPPDIPPSGSFRDLAAKMHTQAGGHKKPTGRRGISS